MPKHIVERTSPKGFGFNGECKKCGATDLTMQDAQTQECPVQGSEADIVDAVTGNYPAPSNALELSEWAVRRGLLIAHPNAVTSTVDFWVREMMEYPDNYSGTTAYEIALALMSAKDEGIEETRLAAGEFIRKELPDGDSVNQRYTALSYELQDHLKALKSTQEVKTNG